MGDWKQVDAVRVPILTALLSLVVSVVLLAACAPPEPKVWVWFTHQSDHPMDLSVQAVFPPRARIVEGRGLDHWLEIVNDKGEAIEGEYELVGDKVTFKPRDLRYETSYTATLRLPDGRSFTANHTTPKVPPRPQDDEFELLIEPVSELDPLVVYVQAAVPVVHLMDVISKKRLGLRIEGESNPAIAGEMKPEGPYLLFRPSQPLGWGTKYTAFLTLSDGRKFERPYETPPRPEGRRPQVLNVYPSGKEIPANHLKFYICFSEPMRQGSDIFNYFSILDDKGFEVTRPWQIEERWSADRSRFTLGIHPGRVKHDVGPREDLGPVLEPNRKYTLMIRAGIRSALGQGLEHDYKREYSVVAEDRDFPMPGNWTGVVPASGTREPLVLRFGEPLDWALIRSCIRILDKDHHRVHGELTVGADEKSLSFVPDEAWENAAYAYDVSSLLEDLAGNRPGMLFDRKAGDPVPPTPSLTILFTPKPK